MLGYHRFNPTKLKPEEIVHYHDAAAQVVEDSCFQLKVLPPDDGVGQGQLKEKRLEDGNLLTRSQTKTLRGQAEGFCLPGGDGVWDSVSHSLFSRLSWWKKNENAFIQIVCYCTEHSMNTLNDLSKSTWLRKSL